MLVDDDVLIDAGTGIGDLALEDLDSIRHVFLTHAHLDHIAGLPMLVDRVFDENFTEPMKGRMNGRVITDRVNVRPQHRDKHTDDQWDRKFLKSRFPAMQG